MATSIAGKSVRELRVFNGVRLIATVTEHVRVGQDNVQAMECTSQGIVVWLKAGDRAETVLVPWSNAHSVRFTKELPIPASLQEDNE